MSSRLSRKKIAEHIAQSITSKSDQGPVLVMVAGYLIANQRVKEIDLIMDEVSYELQSYGIVNAQVSTSEKLLADTRSNLMSFISEQTGAKNVFLDEIPDPSIIGGMRLKLPRVTLDSTINNKLNKFVLSNKR